MPQAFMVTFLICVPWDVFLYVVNMGCSHWLINKADLALARQDRVRWEIQAEIQEKGGVWEMSASQGSKTCRKQGNDVAPWKCIDS